MTQHRIQQDGAAVARVAHNREAGGSNPSPAPTAPPSDLIERLCRSLAFHLWETALTARYMEPLPPPDYLAKIVEAKALIAEAGFAFDALYPEAERTVASEAIS